MPFAPFEVVEREIPADCETECFNAVYAVPGVSSVPDLHQGVLYDVFGFLTVECDVESEPEEFVFQGKDIVSETDVFHLVSKINDD